MARTPRPDYLVLDIETVPDVERWQRPEPPPAPAAGPEEPKPRPRGAHEAAPPAPFPPTWAHRIIVIGCLALDADYQLRRLGVIRSASGPGSADAGSADDRERSLLEELSRFVATDRPILVTYNGRNFDLPVIAQRALCHGVPIGWYYRDKEVRHRYSGERHLDLCDWLADHGATRAAKLDQIARLIGLPGKTGIDGSQVEAVYGAGQLDAIEHYCLADLAQTALLFLRFRLIQGALPPAAYRDRVAALVAALAADGRVSEVLDGLDRARLLGPDVSALTDGRLG